FLLKHPRRLQNPYRASFRPSTYTPTDLSVPSRRMRVQVDLQWSKFRAQDKKFLFSFGITALEKLDVSVAEITDF
ncbi:MAG: hypothetical protein EZS28_032648, partial [Streblomastix strix]